jgi:hypothetical protein
LTAYFVTFIFNALSIINYPINSTYICNCIYNILPAKFSTGNVEKPGVIFGMIRLVIHPEEGINISPETLVSDGV